jgi:(Z)-2-((N-methylformamido)methylene)-5-hydroxybutyrolactone dehydrogenase
MEQFLMKIGSESIPSASGQWIESQNPYTGKAWARIPRATPDDVDRAVRTAHRAFTQGQ